VRAWAAADAPGDFHATVDAARRTYRYHLHAPDASLERARAAATRLSGEHDFHNLTTDVDGTVRRVDCAVARNGEFLVLRVAGDGFPRHFVRRLAAVVHGVASGESGLDRVDRVLSGERLADEAGVPTAPPEPLVLVGVDYPDLSFEPDPVAVETVRAVFDDRRRDGLVRARVAGEVLEGVGSDGGDADGGDVWGSGSDGV
jgi:tRNA pseudouridine38-40 synthase